MELTMMSEIEQDPYLGPLDWRLAQVQAIYWARKGLKNNKFQKKVIDLERLVYQAQQHLLRQGNLIYRAATDKLPASITTWSDYRQALPMQAMFERQIDLFEQHGSTSSGVLSAYRAFIDEAINLCIISGQDQLAQTLVDRVFEKRPDLLPQRNAKDLMRRQMKEQLKSMGGDEFSSLVSSLMMRHFWWKANGDPKKSNALLRHAQQVWLLNSKKNSVGERSTNRSLKALQNNVLLGIFQRKWFHPDVLSKLKVSLSQEQLQWLQEGLKN
jgi:hypothetical protein